MILKKSKIQNYLIEIVKALMEISNKEFI